MHWFWRATIAIIVGVAWGAWDSVHYALVAHLSDIVTAVVRTVPPIARHVYERQVTFASRTLPVVLVALVTYALLTRLLAPSTQVDRDTRCRKCRFILSGISEPRCPECGEKI